MKFNKNNTLNKKPTRKQLRKQARVERKKRKDDYFSKRVKKSYPLSAKGYLSLSTRENTQAKVKAPKNIPKKVVKEATSKVIQGCISVEQNRNKVEKELKKLQKDINKQKAKQLMLANDEEDRNIKKLEKLLKLNKRKTTGIPKSFRDDGLDYLLEVCDPEKMKLAATAEQQFSNFDEHFTEDLGLMTNSNTISKSKSEGENAEFSENDSSDELSTYEEDEESLDELADENVHSDSEENMEDDLEENMHEESEESMSGIDEEYTEGEEEYNRNAPECNSDEIPSKRKRIKNEQLNLHKPDKKIISEVDNTSEINLDDKENRQKKNKIKTTKKNKSEETNKQEKIDTSDAEYAEIYSDEEDSNSQNQSNIKGAAKVNSDGTWEDIYGRLRNKDGSLVKNSGQKYIPPAVRAAMEKGSVQDEKTKEKLIRLGKQLKGFLNRLAESNMHRIATQIEELYMNNSRHDMNETLTNLILESIVSKVLTPERLLMEHVLLIVVLHANVGTEVGANFLQTIIVKFNEVINSKPSVEDKTLDNIIIVLSQLYNFRLFDSKLMFEILFELSKDFVEKNIDCILHVLRNVGFTLRKDDPLALKDLILEIQKKAATICENAVSGTRIKYLLDILMAIKNNNMMKIPNYDTTYSEHLKKIMKGLLRKGNYVTQLNITLEDLLKAEEKGKWWIVGSAWTGNVSEHQQKETTKIQTSSYSQKVLDLAKRHRMNTDTRRNIFCIIMTAEDYIDAFVKLVRLGLTNNQEREIIHVMLYCCLCEKAFNPYYAYLAQKFCDYDRKYQMTIKYSIWDKLKALGNQSAKKLSILAKLLTHLFLQKGLPISALKILRFTELDETTLRFVRQILLGILLHEDVEVCSKVFENVSKSDKLKMFRESLRLFIHHFLLRNMNSEEIDTKHRTLLETRAKIIDKMLVSSERAKFWG